MPCTPGAPSLKTWSFARGEFATGTTGFGFIMISPRDGVTADRDAIWCSSATYAGTTTTTAAAGVVAARTNSPYLASSFSANDTGSRYRVVSVGLRIRYSGTSLNRGGFVLSLHHPQHNDLNGLTYAQADGFNVAVRNRPKEDWITVLFCPVLSGDYDFVSTFPAAYRFMAHFIQAPGGTTATYEYEMFLNYEVNGQTIRGVTHSMQDPVGMAAVGNSLQGVQMVHTGQSAHTDSVLKRAVDSLASGVSEGSHPWVERGLKYVYDTAKKWTPLALEAMTSLLL